MKKYKKTKDLLKENLYPIGKTKKNEFIGLMQSDRNGIMVITGKTGTGKSIVLEQLVISDINNGIGGLLIDPYGDLIDGILKYVPPKYKNKVTVFKVKDTSTSENIKKFDKEIHINEMAKDSQKLLLCNLNYQLIGSNSSREIGTYIIKKFLAINNSKKTYEDRTLYIDEAHNFLDAEIIKKIISSKADKLNCVLTDQSLSELSKKQVKSILNATRNSLCFSVDYLTAKYVNEKFKFCTDLTTLRAVEKYYFYASLISKSKKQPNLYLRSLFPICYPKKK